MLAAMTSSAGDAFSPSPAQRGLLTNQVIAVTSADQGYGRPIGTALAHAGASVILVGTAPENLAAIASGIEQQGGQVIPLAADVSVPLDCISALGRILDIYGELHGVVHLADKRAYSTFQDLSENEWMDLFGANVKSTVALTQVLRRRHPQTWLTIVGPHRDEAGLQVQPQRGAIRSLVEHAGQEDMRLNLLLPSRASSGDDRLDQPLTDAVLALAMPSLGHLGGNVLEVPLPPLPRAGQARSDQLRAEQIRSGQVDRQP